MTIAMATAPSSPPPPPPTAKRRLKLVPTPPDATRPRTRGECANVPRPCPYVSCRYTLFLEVERRKGRIRINHPRLGPHGQMVMAFVANEPSPLDMPPGESCALDVAESGARGQKEIARLFGGIKLDWIRENQRAAEAHMRELAGDDLRDVLALYAPEPARPSDLAIAGQTLDVEPRQWTTTPTTPTRTTRHDEPPTPQSEAKEIDDWATLVAGLMSFGFSLRQACERASEIQEDDEQLELVKSPLSRVQAATPPPPTVVDAQCPAGGGKKSRRDNRIGNPEGGKAKR